MQGGHRDDGSPEPPDRSREPADGRREPPVDRRGIGGRRPVELTFAVDDEESPAKVTVSPRHAVNNTTAWLTIDVDHVVDLAERT